MRWVARFDFRRCSDGGPWLPLGDPGDGVLRRSHRFWGIVAGEGRCYSACSMALLSNRMPLVSHGPDHVRGYSGMQLWKWRSKWLNDAPRFECGRLPQGSADSPLPVFLSSEPESHGLSRPVSSSGSGAPCAKPTSTCPPAPTPVGQVMPWCQQAALRPSRSNPSPGNTTWMPQVNVSCRMCMVVASGPSCAEPLLLHLEGGWRCGVLITHGRLSSPSTGARRRRRRVDDELNVIVLL